MEYAAKESQGASYNRSRDPVNSMDWDMNLGWEGSLKLARQGWPEGAAKIERLMDKVEQNIRKLLPLQRNILMPAMNGGRVSVPAYLAGRPKQYLALRKEAATCKTVTIAVNSSMSGDVTSEEVMRRGVAIAAAIRALEQRRVRVELVSLKCSEHSNFPGGTYASACVVKRAQDKLQPDMVAFALAHPAFPRRIGFAFAESVCRKAGKQVPMGYGCPSNFALPNAVVLPTKPCYSDEEMAAFTTEIIKSILQ